jgi:hypothetical protein
MFLCIYSTFVFAQEKHGAKWGIGLSKSIVEFKKDSISYSFIGLPTDPKTILYKGISSICDSAGKFLFITDGFRVYNWLGDTLPGGGGRLNNECYTISNGNKGLTHQSTIILPRGNEEYYLITATFGDENCEYVASNQTWYFPDTFRYDELRYSIVDMKKNNGTGAITVHNKLFSKNIVFPWYNYSNLTATRHANGRDWLLLKPDGWKKEKLFSFLVTQDTIIELPVQATIKTAYTPLGGSYIGQSCFSTDGSLYAQCNVGHHVSVFDFDRCSGKISNQRIIRTDTFADKFIGGVCFSPNNRFLYFVNSYNVYQYDLQEPDSNLALQIVSETDTSVNFPDYSGMQLTPTGRIWLGHWNGISNDINAIMKPNEKGKACEFKFDYAKLFSNTNEPPNMVHYGLGALKGSACDTIKPLASLYGSWQLYPNPNKGSFKVRVPLNNASKVHAIIYNSLGQKVQDLTSEIDFKYEASFKVNLVSGLYLAKFVSGDETYFSKITLW